MGVGQLALGERGLSPGGLGLEWPAGAQHLQGATDIDCQVGSHPAGLGDHEYGFGQAASISSL